MTNSNGNLLGNLPILDAKNWDRWSVQMEVVFGFQEVLEVVKNGYQDLGENPDTTQQAAHKESKKKDCKALFLIHQSVDVGHFEKIASAKTSKEAWDILVKSHEGGEKLKKVKLQTFKRQFELMQMEKSEKVCDYFTRILTLTNQMKVCGERVSDQMIVEKVMRTFTPNFDYIVAAIEESKDLADMKVEELQASLEAHEQRLADRSSEKEVTQALQSQILSKKGKNWKGKGKWKQGKYNGGGSNQNQDHSDHDPGESSRKKGDGDKGSRRKFDRNKIQCYNCQKFGHFADECKFNNKGQRKKNSDEAHLAQENSDSDNEPVLLMTTSEIDPPATASSDSWYLDTGCSNHMTCRKEWLTDLDPNKKTKIRFADFSTVTSEGIGTVAIKKKDGQMVRKCCMCQV